MIIPGSVIQMEHQKLTWNTLEIKNLEITIFINHTMTLKKETKKIEVIEELSKPGWISSKKDSPFKHPEFFREVENTKFSKTTFIVHFPDEKLCEVSFMCTKDGNWVCYLWDKPTILTLDFDYWRLGRAKF